MKFFLSSPKVRKKSESPKDDCPVENVPLSAKRRFSGKKEKAVKFKPSLYFIERKLILPNLLLSDSDFPDFLTKLILQTHFLALHHFAQIIERITHTAKGGIDADIGNIGYFCVSCR